MSRAGSADRASRGSYHHPTQAAAPRPCTCFLFPRPSLLFPLSLYMLCSSRCSTRPCLLFLGWASATELTFWHYYVPKSYASSEVSDSVEFKVFPLDKIFIQPSNVSRRSVMALESMYRSYSLLFVGGSSQGSSSCCEDVQCEAYHHWLSPLLIILLEGLLIILSE